MTEKKKKKEELATASFAAEVERDRRVERALLAKELLVVGALTMLLALREVLL